MRENNRKPIEKCRRKLPQFTTMNVIDGQAGLVIYSSLIFYSLTIDNILNIIVLLILAGVSIAMLTGNNGILAQASNAKEEQSHGAVREAIGLLYNEYQIQIRTGSNIKLASTEDVQVQEVTEESRITFFNFLTGENKSNIDYTKSGSDEEGYVLDVEKLTGSKQSLGNGTTEDIYIIEDDGMNYKITYYETEETSLEISAITKEESEQDPFKYTQADIDETLSCFDYITNEEYTSISSVLEGYYDNWYPIKYFSLTKLVVPGEIEGKKVHFSLQGQMQCFDQLETLIFLDGCEINFGDSSHLPKTIRNVRLPNNLTVLQQRTFAGCSNLEKIYLPNSLNTISEGAFYGCTSLEKLTIPSSVTSIENYAFNDCPNLTITVEAGSKLIIDDFANTGIDLSKVIFEDE